MKTFKSEFEKMGVVTFPDFTGVRVMMLPIVLGNMGTVPDYLENWRPALAALCAMMPDSIGEVGYVTIDEAELKRGEVQRRPGLHVDGVYHGGPGGWAVPAPWAPPDGRHRGGMLIASTHRSVRVWSQEFEGEPGSEGECEHLLPQCQEDSETWIEPDQVLWCGGLCVHEAMPMPDDAKRQFVRLSMPSTAPWFEGYTINPKVKPTGPILPRRAFMDYRAA